MQPFATLADIERLERTPLAQTAPHRSPYALIRAAAQRFPEREAFTFLPDAALDTPPVRTTYAALLGQIHRAANLFRALGVGPDDAVALLAPNTPEAHAVLWGAQLAGRVCPINYLLQPEHIAALLKAANVRVLVALGPNSELAVWPVAEQVVRHHDVPLLQLRVGPGDGPQLVPVLQELLATQSDVLGFEPDLNPDRVVALFHTGGTTGAPKLARHSHGAQVFTAWGSVQMQGIRPEDVGINGYPLFHVAGVLPGSLAALSAGVETIIPTTGLFRNREVIANYWRLVERYRCTYLSAVPTVLAALANVGLGGADISTLRYCRTGAAILAPELAARFERLFGLHIHESLGMTEMAGISTITPPGVNAPAGCVGWRLPYTQLRIVALDAQGNASDQDLPPGQPGMVLFQSPNLFSGFLDAADTAKAFTPDGWLATGDLGFVDEQGRLHLSGRSKDLIIRSGHNIDPKVIEDALGAHPAVQLCAAVGAPDAYAGELPVVYATLVPGAQAVTEAELLAFTAERVDEAVARPRWVQVLETMPVTNVGKIYKPELRQRAACHTVQALVDGVCGPVTNGLRPQVQPEGDNAVRVAVAPCAQADALAARLREVLAPLPITVRITTAPAAGSPQTP